MGFEGSSPIDDREVEEDDIDGDTEAEVEAESGVEAIETEPLRRARDRVIGESIMIRKLTIPAVGAGKESQLGWFRSK